MAVTLAADYHVRDWAADVEVDQAEHAEHFRDLIENKHWILAKRHRRLHWAEQFAWWNGYGLEAAIIADSAKVGAGWVKILEYLPRTGPGKVTTISPYVMAYATGLGCTLRYNFIDLVTGGLTAQLDFALAAGAAWYGGAPVANLKPSTEYIVAVWFNVAALAVASLQCHAMFEQQITAAGDLP